MSLSTNGITIGYTNDAGGGGGGLSATGGGGGGTATAGGVRGTAKFGEAGAGSLGTGRDGAWLGAGGGGGRINIMSM